MFQTIQNVEILELEEEAGCFTDTEVANHEFCLLSDTRFTTKQWLQWACKTHLQHNKYSSRRVENISIC
jgi:hypothetical protein